MSDSINHPKHYNAGKFEVIDVIDDWKLGFALGNTVKYIARAAHKGSELEDLKKAAWYLNHRIEELETPAVQQFQEDLHFIMKGQNQKLCGASAGLGTGLISEVTCNVCRLAFGRVSK